ncbi:MAG: mandelate racemase/muconate lactonizing enzyme family protein [Chloroflexi bacterium]|nr:mandelate racemase/muconate lactonizing enzyme family protein [Chloroflexota bacterium]
MPVTEVLAATEVVPLSGVVALSTRVLENREYTLVRIKSSSGAVGFGFCNSGSKAGHLSTIAVRDLLREHVIGKEPFQVEAIWQAMYQDSLLHGRRGSVLRAMSAIDIALWDLIAREAKLPLHALLGGRRKDTVPTYVTGAAYAVSGSARSLADEVKAYADAGFKAMKIKIGRLKPAEDAERVRVCRQAAGDRMQLFLDANNAWPDAPTAIRAIRLFEEFQPGWMEEPVMPDEIEMMAEVAAAVEVPIATGELEATRWGFKQLIDYKAAAILQPDAVACGGVTEWRRIAALAAGSGLPVAPHWFPEVHVHLVAATPNATWVEYVPDTHLSNIGLLFRSQLEVRDGELVVPGGPGLGLELDEAAVERYSKDGWR